MIFLKRYKKYCTRAELSERFYYIDCNRVDYYNCFYKFKSRNEYVDYSFYFYLRSYNYMVDYDFRYNDYLFITKPKYRIEIKLTAPPGGRTFNIIFVREFDFKCSGYE